MKKKIKLLEDLFIESSMDIVKKGTTIKIFEEPVTVPVEEPKTAPATKPNRRREPFNPPRPSVKPKPKAKKKELTSEAYDDEASQSTRDFWPGLRQKGDHPFSKHPVMAMHGDRLSRSGFDDLNDIGFDPIDFMSAVQTVMRIEAPHISELEELAKRITVEIWGVPAEMLDANITPQNDINDDDDNNDDFGDDYGNEEEDLGEITPEIRSQINKRITMNTMTQGAAVHQMKSMHYLIDQELNKIDERLVPLYTKIAKMSHKSYWLIDFVKMANLSSAAVGSAKVEWPEQQEQEEIPKVVAKALVFPVLTQELSKGVMELLTMHGYSSQDENTQKHLQKHADRLIDEPYLIQVGPALWRKFLQVVPKDVQLSRVISSLSMEEPDVVHDLIDHVVDNPDRAREILATLVADEEVVEDGY